MVLKVELPLEPGVLRVIAAVQAGARAQGLDPLLVGAAARDLLLVHVYGQRVRRAVRRQRKMAQKRHENWPPSVRH